MQAEKTGKSANEPSALTPVEVVHGYFAALNSSDVQGIVALFAEDAVLMADDYSSATGRGEIRAAFEGAFTAMKMQQECHVDHVVERDGIAVVRTHSTGMLTLLGPGTTLDQNHRELYVLRRSTEGWRITDYMFNSPA